MFVLLTFEVRYFVLDRLYGLCTRLVKPIAFVLAKLDGSIYAWGVGFELKLVSTRFFLVLLLLGASRPRFRLHLLIFRLALHSN